MPIGCGWPPRSSCPEGIPIASPESSSPQDVARTAPVILERVLEDGIVLTGGRGAMVFANDAAHALLGGPDLSRRSWAWLSGRLDEEPHAMGARGEGADISLPDALGGRRLRVRTITVDPSAGEDEVDGVCLLKDRDSLARLHEDLRLALQMRRHAARLRQTAHDLNAPLHSLALHLDLLRGHVADDELGEAEQRIDLLAQEFDRLRRMVRGALAGSRVPGMERHGFDLRRLVRDVLAVMRAEAREAGVEVSLSLPDSRVPVRAVQDRLEQALVNLVVNALEAMPRGGRLSLSLTVEQGRAVLRVADTGAGLSPEARAHAFQLHFTTKAGGSGLGLYTSRATLRALGGELELAEAEGGGCLVTARLPLDTSHTGGDEAACSTS